MNYIILVKNPELSFKERGYFQDAILTIEDQKMLEFLLFQFIFSLLFRYGYVTPTLTKFFVMISKGNIDSKSVAAVCLLYYNEILYTCCSFLMSCMLRMLDILALHSLFLKGKLKVHGLLKIFKKL